MSDPIITVENLGKRYSLRHEAKAPYHTLREALAGKARRMFSGGTPDSHSRTQEDFWALRDVNFAVDRGDVVGIIGRNGAGKSTLLKILSRITEPTTGRIRLGGRVASLLEVGTGFHPELSGRENIFLNGAILGMTKAEIRSKFDEIVAFAEVEKFLDTPVKHYSSGMYVRLAFAVAAHLEPEILIVDEVLAVGDTQFRAKCMSKMSAIARQNRTVLFVSHDMAAIQKLTRNAILLDRGRLASFGPTSETAQQYLQSFAETEGDLLLTNDGSNDFNFVRVRILDDEGRSIHTVSLMQPFRIALQYAAKAEFRDAIVGIGVHSLDGTPLFVTHTNDFGELISLLQGSHEIQCRITPNYLRHGSYYLSLGMVSRGRLVQHVPRACGLTVERVLHDTSAHYDDREGRLFIPMKWSHSDPTTPDTPPLNAPTAATGSAC